MDAQEYNRLREQAFIQQRITDERLLREQLRKLYQESMLAIEADMNRWLGRFATDRGISMKEARKLVDKTDVEALADKAKKYVEEKNFSPQANEELQRYNLKMRMSRHELLRNEINLELIALGDAEAKLLRDYFNDTYLEEVQRQAGILDLSSKSQEVLRHNMTKVVDSSYKSATWSDRLWANNDSLRARLGVGLRATMLQGENPRAWARRLRQELRKESLPEKGKDSAIFRSERLAITEASRIQIAAQLDCYKESGYNALEVVTEPGACSECIAHDGAIVPLEEAQQGVNIPSFHPFCRCSTAVAILDENGQPLKSLGSFLKSTIEDIKRTARTETYMRKLDFKTNHPDVKRVVRAGLDLMPAKDLEFLKKHRLGISETNLKDTYGYYNDLLRRVAINPSYKDALTFPHEFVHFVDDILEITRNNAEVHSIIDGAMKGAKLTVVNYGGVDYIQVESPHFVELYQGRTYLTLADFQRNGGTLTYTDMQEFLSVGYEWFLKDSATLELKLPRLKKFFEEKEWTK